MVLNHVRSIQLTLLFFFPPHQNTCISSQKEGLKLYAKAGEKGNVNALTWTPERREEKKKGSEQAVGKLLNHKGSIKEHIEEAEKKKAETDKLNAEQAKIKQEKAEKRKAEMENRTIAAPKDASGDKKKRKATDGRGRPKKAKTSSKDIYKGRRVGKLFPLENPTTGELEETLFFGTVESFNSRFWHVIYDDDVSLIVIYVHQILISC